MSYSLEVEKEVEVCTDPQRRCYHGTFFSSRMEKVRETLLSHKSLENIVDTAQTFSRANQDRIYRVFSEEGMVMAAFRNGEDYKGN